MRKLLAKLEIIAKNTPNEKKAKMLIIAALRESKRKYKGYEID